MKSFKQLAVLLPLIALAGGCKYFDESSNNDNILAEVKNEVPTASTFGNGPEKVWLDKAKENFKHGEYGLAERYYRQAIEERRDNVEAWLGLAASYDHLKRFDEADKAYKVVVAMAGKTPSILNNLGYHYMLKGDYRADDQALHEAAEKDPANPYVQNNLALLANWKVKAGVSG